MKSGVRPPLSESGTSRKAQGTYRRMTDKSPLIEQHEFCESDLVGGHPAVDFVNTVTGWDVRPRDWVPDYAAFVNWARFSGILTRAEADRLLDMSAASPGTAANALEEAKGLRTAMRGLLNAHADGTPPRAEDLASVESIWRSFNSYCELAIDPATGIRIQVGNAGLELISVKLVDAFIRLGEDFASPRLKRCAGVNCGWFFFDRSKPGRRRWCDMATCGNAAKYARHRQQRSD